MHHGDTERTEKTKFAPQRRGERRENHIFTAETRRAQRKPYMHREERKDRRVFVGAEQERGALPGRSAIAPPILHHGDTENTQKTMFK